MKRMVDPLNPVLRLALVSREQERRSQSTHIVMFIYLLGVVIAVRTFNGHDLFSCVAGAPNATGKPNNAVTATA
jgi:hypothetical protein